MGQQQPQSNYKLLFQLVSCRDVEGIKSLCHEGTKLEWIDGEGRTPLIVASMEAELYEVAKALLELGSDVDAYRPGCMFGTSLHHAAKRGLKNTVNLLLSHGANPFLLNDDSQTPLQVARANGYNDVVRAIESHISLFSGWMRELYGPSFLEFFAPQLLSRRVWVVIVPTGSRDLSKPIKLELAVYSSLQDAQPRTVMALWKANMQKLGSEQSGASVMIVDNSSISRHKRERRRRSSFVSQGRHWVQVDKRLCLKLATATKGDEKQLNWFCEACKGVPQAMNPPMFLQSSQTEISAPLASSDAINHSVSMAKDDFIYQELTPLVEGSSNKYESKDGVCVICVDASSEAVCVPCGHVAGCITCLKKIKDKEFGCPVCRANIDQVIKLYHV